ncbi:uncharacterized protein HMPREF1541_09019 [Cyphellophora europaea CBS 101466]|uniref:Uncharacterized protein n=1 Tax=Cyphellophora europaea (strain CBS 101466) TaxID=1220924 RepID=W2RJT8_CYPE1|nr:uncharacterized protein HMPREF1541_09019 [Cyphellophora europaea CBS 101466]ETN36741.1 hypothetical protein HMPREF1541_09019 [Cyphellophora europaea CBS 101466]
MATTADGKKVKTEKGNQDGDVELINSLNEDERERHAVEEASKGTNRANAALAGGENKGGSVDLAPKSGERNENSLKPVKSVEHAPGSDKVADDDAEPQLLQEDSGPSELFPGVPCVTVAKRCKKGNDDPAPLFLNRYGPRAKGWFVWSTTPHIRDGMSVEDLQNVSERFHRVLDYPREQGKPKYRAANVHGILNIVWECEGLEQSPQEAAELLNPAKVKKAVELPTSKSRRDWLHKGKDHRLENYRITHIDVKFHQKINGLTTRPDNKDQGDVYNNWELATQYKALYRKDQIKAEWRVYEAAKLQAKRFLDWFEQRHPDGYAEYRQSQSREPTVQPFKRSSQSASPGVSPSARPTPSLEPADTAKPTTPSDSASVGDSKPPPPNLANQGTQPLKHTQGGNDARQEGSSSQASLSIEELKEAVLEGYCAAHDIRSAGDMNSKQKMKFDVYFEVYAKNKGY